MKGVHTLGNRYKRGVLKSFDNLVEQFKLSNNQFWIYLYLRHLHITTFGSTHTPPQGMDLIKEILRIAGIGHWASLQYMNHTVYLSNTALKTL